MQLPPFNADATCPKCGHDNVLMVYAAEHKSWSEPSCGLRSADKYHEHMDRTCQRCHFTWPESVLEHVTPSQQGLGEE